MKFEIINIPWTDQLVNYTSDVFRNAKYIVEEALDLAYINEHLTFYGGYVRSIVTRFYKGFDELNPLWADLVLQAQNATNSTNTTSLDDFPEGILPGEPIITLVQPEFEEGQRGVSEEQYYSTMVEVCIQNVFQLKLLTCILIRWKYNFEIQWIVFLKITPKKLYFYQTG